MLCIYVQSCDHYLMFLIPKNENWTEGFCKNWGNVGWKDYSNFCSNDFIDISCNTHLSLGILSIKFHFFVMSNMKDIHFKFIPPKIRKDDRKWMMAIWEHVHQRFAIFAQKYIRRTNLHLQYIREKYAWIDKYNKFNFTSTCIEKRF